MQITGHGVSAATRDEFTRATGAFFALDLETKKRYRCPPGVNRGYTPPRAESLANSLGLATAADLFEAINVGATAADYPGLDLPADFYPANVYPAREVPEFEAAVTGWFQAAGAVARTMDALIECLPSCVSAANRARYEPVTVGGHLAAKLAGSRGGQLNPYATREAARLRTA